jgi:hypothetical protein
LARKLWSSDNKLGEKDLAKPVCFFSVSLVFRSKVVPFLWVEEGHLSDEGFLTYSREMSESPSKIS